LGIRGFKSHESLRNRVVGARMCVYCTVLAHSKLRTPSNTYCEKETCAVGQAWQPPHAHKHAHATSILNHSIAKFIYSYSLQL
ncbi:MAG TPA: hypothetical protein VHF44_03275, partial [Nitrososphaeraceae archaeon]|nr:hypothetical protein [Nitrososphaeraceae archaeon]